MLVTRGGRRHAKLTLQIDPEGGVAMRDNRYPITAFGMDNLLTRLIDVAKADLGLRRVPGFASVVLELTPVRALSTPLRTRYHEIISAFTCASIRRR